MTLILNFNFPEQQFGSLSVPVEHLRLGMSVFVHETIVSEILFLMSCMRCNVELNTLSHFLSDFKYSCPFAPSSFTSSHLMR